MQDDLRAVLALWEVDHAILVAEERLASLDAAIKAAEERVAQVAAERAEVEARRAALTEEESALQKRLDDTTTRRVRTQALIDSGKATDFLVATRQVEAAKVQGDELETRILEILDELESLAGRQDELGRSATLAAARAREARADRDAAAPDLHAELARLGAARETRWKALLRDDQNRYRNLRAQNLTPVARLTGTVCSGCRREVPPQVVYEIRRGMKNHHCRSCGRWLYEPEEESGESAEG